MAISYKINDINQTEIMAQFTLLYIVYLLGLDIKINTKYGQKKNGGQHKSNFDYKRLHYENEVYSKNK